ncbi:hypothetical protein CDL12_07088 [Handroanthus impetiginosus]|uniref:Uncharacterized protein n=1 Tax=Handroanthus impetiginosus TaxID=429701 RepID=A0A2G9HRT6_9LAMI|nr:hypothetical protein CDL12_07088 [Handroanthus impetiginosus]
MLDGYSSNLLLLIGFKDLPNPVWKPLVELSSVFKYLCSTNLRHDYLAKMERNIPIILCKLKKTVKQKAQVEGSICEAFHCREISKFCSYYFEFHVHTLRTRVGKHDDGCQDNSIPSMLSIFNQLGRVSRASATQWLSDKECKSTMLNVLLNCEEVKVFIK